MHEGNDEGRNNDPLSLRYGAAGEASMFRDPSIASNFSSCKGIFFPGFLILFVRLLDIRG